MSRIGKKPIPIPQGVEVRIDGQEVSIKGSRGELRLGLRPEIKAEIAEAGIVLSPRIESKKTAAFWGLSRALLANMIEGVSRGFQKKLDVQGVGYRAKAEGDELVLQVGFSHPVELQKPEGIDFSVEKNIITVSGIDKEKVGQWAAKIRAVRPPEPYKGKGIRYLGEVVRKKEGKKTAATQ